MRFPITPQANYFFVCFKEKRRPIPIAQNSSPESQTAAMRSNSFSPAIDERKRAILLALSSQIQSSNRSRRSSPSKSPLQTSLGPVPKNTCLQQSIVLSLHPLARCHIDRLHFHCHSNSESRTRRAIVGIFLRL